MGVVVAATGAVLSFNSHQQPNRIDQYLLNLLPTNVTLASNGYAALSYIVSPVFNGTNGCEEGSRCKR